MKTNESCASMDMTFYKQYCALKLRTAPFRLKDDFETVKTVAAIDALADRAETLTHGTNESRFGWETALGIHTENLAGIADSLLTRLEKGEFPLAGYFAEPGGALIDHSFVVEGDTVHVFYNRGYIAYDWPERFVDSIGHAVSRDLIHWDIKPPVLTAMPGGHDDYQVWSPGVIRYNDAYWMFYTGVNYNIAQAPCLARSTDLYHWERVGSSPLFYPGKWCPWSPDTWSDGRDGMTFRDDDGTFYNYYCSYKKVGDAPGHTVMGIASSKDLFCWNDEGCLQLDQCEASPESPFIMKHGEKYYMFYTNCQFGGTFYATSDHPVHGWTEHEQILPGVSCSEILEFLGKWYISLCAHLGGCMHFLGFHEFFWNDDGTVSVGEFLK